MTETSILSKTYRARWIWSAGRWVADGRITIADRKIMAVGTHRIAGEIDLGDCLILPGLVNAHTHLEFSGLAAPIPYDQTFASWIRNVVEWRRGQTDASVNAAIEQGLRESAAAGVTTLGEISTRYWETPTAWEPGECRLADSQSPHPQLVVFDEILGLQPAAVQPQMADACRHLAVGATQHGVGSPANRNWQPSWTAALSPHAPYSTSRELLAEAIRLASSAACPVAMHLAETREELELLASGTGPLAELFTEWGLWKPGLRAAFRTPLEVLNQLAQLSRVLVIHGNYLTAEEVDFLAGKDQFSVVYCPRTHRYFQHEPYPLAALLNRSIRVALGTDSRASNPDLSLLAEVRQVASQHPQIAPSTLIEMATRHGAEALGRGDSIGTLAPGKQAAFCVLRIPPGIHDPFEVVIASA